MRCSPYRRPELRRTAVDSSGKPIHRLHTRAHRRTYPLFCDFRLWRRRTATFVGTVCDSSRAQCTATDYGSRENMEAFKDQAMNLLNGSEALTGDKFIQVISDLQHVLPSLNHLKVVSSRCTYLHISFRRHIFRSIYRSPTDENVCLTRSCIPT